MGLSIKMHAPLKYHIDFIEHYSPGTIQEVNIEKVYSQLLYVTLICQLLLSLMLAVTFIFSWHYRPYIYSNGEGSLLSLGNKPVVVLSVYCG